MRTDRRAAAGDDRAQTVAKFAADQTGANSIEYALIAALIGIACLLAVKALGLSVSGTYSDMSVKIENIKN